MLNAKKTIILVLVGIMVLSLVSAVGFSAKKPTPLKVCFPSSSWGNSADPGLLEEVKKYAEKQTNTTITMIAPPMNTYTEKINVLLASGDIPDAYRVTKAMVNINTFTQRGYTAGIDKFIKKNKTLKNIDPKYFNYMRVNGVVRGIPMGKESEKFIWLRKDLADGYGVKLSSTPTTDEFYNEMKKVNDRIPFTFVKFLDNLPFFYHSFGVYDEFIKDKKGKYYDVFNTPDMKACLTWLNKMYKDGVLDKEFPTNDNTVLRNNLISGKAVANIDYDIRYFYYLTEIQRLDPNAKPVLQPIFELKGPKGFGGTLNEACQDALAVSSKSKYPQEAVDLIAWAYYTVDGQKAMQVGLPGKHYVVENGVAKVTPQAEAGGMSLDLQQLLKRQVSVDDLLKGFGFTFPNQENFGTYINLTKEVSKYTGRKEVITMGQSAIYDKVGPSLVKKRQEIALKAIIGTVSIEDAFKEYDAFFKSINGDQIIKELNTKKKAQ